jgi:hypothetical protein
MNDSQTPTASSLDDRSVPLIYHLHALGDLSAARSPDVPDKFPKEVNGQPVAYFWANAIRTGRYVHPAGHFELSVDEHRLDEWARNFHRMKEAGIDVPVPVDHSAAARDNLGFVVDAKRDGDSLMLLHQLIGQEAIDLAARNKVSLGIDPQFRDGLGNEFGDCIVHSSLTPIPVVPGQGQMMPMSQQGGATVGAGGMVFHLAGPRDSPETPPPSPRFEQRADALVAGGHITPACRDRLVRLFSHQRPASLLTLSRQGESTLIDALVEALSANRAVVLEERTGLQTLARLIPGEEPTVNPQLQSRMVKMANGR